MLLSNRREVLKPSKLQRIGVVVLSLLMAANSIGTIHAQAADSGQSPDVTVDAALYPGVLANEPTGFTLADKSEGLQIGWRLAGNDQASAAQTDPAAAQALVTKMLPSVRYQGYDLPMRLVPVALDDVDALAKLRLNRLSSLPLAEDALLPAAPLLPAVLDPTAIDLTPMETVQLPNAPFFVVRAGKIHGRFMAILAVSPIYQENGALKLAARFDVHLPGVRALPADEVGQLVSSSGLALQQSPNLVDEPGVNPVNPAAAKQSWAIKVGNSGLQRVSSAMLAAAGLNLAAIDSSKLHLLHNGVEVALQVLPDELRFYTAKVGDRWNTHEYYWLTLEATDGLRMATRDVTPAGAAGRSSANEKGYWIDNKLYESRVAGPDGDHWFHTFMDTLASSTSNPDTITVPIQNLLPLTSGASQFVLNTSPATRTTGEQKCVLQVDMSSEIVNVEINATSETGALASSWASEINTTAKPSALKITLSNVNITDCGARFDSVEWQQAVALNFSSKGALFRGEVGTWTYNWQGLPADAALYDVSNPDQPQLLTGWNASGFQDGDIARDYALGGTGVYQTPQVQARSGVNFSGGAQAVYIAPAQFVSALQPLVSQRKAQGYSVAVVNVQDIYDAWSFGLVSPQAIRNFLRFARSNWNPAPISVVLVGDGTNDPKNYEGKNNTNFIPPYLEDVDPWDKEVPCENCYAQLDGERPENGDRIGGGDGTFFSMDVWLGRFPVKTEQELQAVVNKILSYENAKDVDALWRSSVFVWADNYIKSVTDGKAVPDPAGDFAALSEDMIHSIPHKQTVRRVFYDPFPQFSDPKSQEYWRISDWTKVTPQIVTALSSGAGLTSFNGHANHWFMANMETGGGDKYMFNLFDPDGLSNKDRLFIHLSMTCLSSQFSKPATSGTTLDERLFLSPNGGAVAVWGPAGKSVAHGHDKLQVGFHRLLWQQPMTTPLGKLLEAGYNELLTTITCCQDALQTFTFFGDPLTPARVKAAWGIYLPTVQKQ